MSYILEALKLSEQARERIAATPRYSLQPPVVDGPPSRRSWPAALAVALLVNAAVLYVWLHPPLPAANSVPSSKVPPDPVRQPLAEPAPAPPAPLIAALPAEAPRRVEPKPMTLVTVPEPAKPPEPAPTARTREPTAPAPPAPPPPAAPAGRAEPPVALPPALPPLSLSGFVREEGSPGMVIVNDKLLREGDEVMPGLRLETILSDGVIFSYKGQRFKR